MTTVLLESIPCCVHCRQVPNEVSLDTLTKVVATQTHPAVLGANTSVSRYSIFAAEPVETLELKNTATPFEPLRTFLGKYRLEGTSSCACKGLPFPGWIGFFSYTLAHYIEKLPPLPPDDIDLPLIYLSFYDKTIVYDHKTGMYFLQALEYAGQTQTVEEKFHRLTSWLNDAARYPRTGNASLPPGRIDERRFTANMTCDDYVAAIRKIKQYILDGDVYQINFSRRLMCDFSAEAGNCFVWHNRHNPCPLAAYISSEDWTIVSASPELFLQIEKNTILTRPIKGTRPRTNRIDQTDFNRRQYEALLNSEKEQAELMMIIDLERNDLARVCLPGTRHVSRPRTIDAHPTLFHASADIAGTLLRPNDPAMFCDILRAAFPGGSITGAPKIRAMEIIEELEPTARGLYTGSIGHIGIDFNATLNIAIRTIILRDKKAYIQTGGGIVADSSPDAEWREMLLKAEALQMSLEATL